MSYNLDPNIKFEISLQTAYDAKYLEGWSSYLWLKSHLDAIYYYCEYCNMWITDL